MTPEQRHLFIEAQRRYYAQIAYSQNQGTDLGWAGQFPAMTEECYYLPTDDQVKAYAAIERMIEEQFGSILSLLMSDPGVDLTGFTGSWFNPDPFPGLLKINRHGMAYLHISRNGMTMRICISFFNRTPSFRILQQLTDLIDASLKDFEREARRLGRT